MISFNWTEIDRLYAEGMTAGRQGVVGLLVLRGRGSDLRIFAQRRSLTRKLFPGCWDLVGGHFEAGETPEQAARRELREETGWELAEVLALRKMVDWESPGENGTTARKREFVLAVTITGQWDSPQLEAGKVSQGLWVGLQEVKVLLEGRGESDNYVYQLIVEELTR